jgi:hypothetical protein
MSIIEERLVKNLCNEGSRNHVVEILKGHYLLFLHVLIYSFLGHALLHC